MNGDTCDEHPNDENISELSLPYRAAGPTVRLQRATHKLPFKHTFRSSTQLHANPTHLSCRPIKPAPDTITLCTVDATELEKHASLTQLHYQINLKFLFINSMLLKIAPTLNEKMI